MTQERLSMRQVREILRQKWLLGRSHREVRRSLGVGIGTVTGALHRAQAAGLTAWAAVEALSEGELERRLYGIRAMDPGARERKRPDCARLDRELRRKGVTLQLLHLEYLEEQPGGYAYTQFCEHYRRWKRRQRPPMRQTHKAGEKLLVDYSGNKPWIVDPRTGERREVELFVAAMGASSLTYVEATASQKSEDWIASHTRAVEFLGGVPEAVVSDQLRSGVTRPCRYEPEIQRTYEEWATHHGTTILPARPRRPRDKAKVEAAVLVAQRWILARLRHETHFSLESLNARIRELCEELNRRPMRHVGRSRLELFEEIDRPALGPLPERRFVFARWKLCRVNIDYHVDVERHLYSVPHALIHERVEARLTATTVEIFFRGERVASHRRSEQRGRHTTDPAHMPKAHRSHLEWSPSRMIRWAGKIGPQTRRLVGAILRERPHPEQGYRSCLGILRLERRYGRERLEAACERAHRGGARSYRHVDSILRHGLDRMPPPPGAAVREGSAAAAAVPRPRHHENLRGPEYYA